MAARERRRLTDSAIARLRAREIEYTVWDDRAPGLGVRVRPTGGKSYVLLLRSGGRSRRVSLGPVSLRTVAEARRDCLARQATHEPDRESAPRRALPRFREFVEGEWKDVHFARYKPSTKTTLRSLLASQLIPAFGSVPLDRMSTARVRRWFDAFSRTAPANANRGLEALRQIMNFAIACGYADANPAAGIALNPRPKLTRFLSREEIARLHRALDGLATRANRQQVDIIRLLLLTGCRRGEIVRLRWSELRDDKLMLEESKTGPRSVPLNSQARRILARQPQNGSPFVFPSPRDPSRPRYSDLDLWQRVRKQAGIEDVRLHDLRHTYASHAVLQGVPLPVVSRLLGHKRPSMTLRYAHVGDREVEAAAERIGAAIARALGLGTQVHPSDASSGRSSG